MEAHHIEVTSYDGASKWIRNITSHAPDAIQRAWEDCEKIVFVDSDGCETAVDMAECFMIRFQNNQVFKRRSQEAGNGRRPA